MEFMEKVDVKIRRILPDAKIPVCNGAGWDLFLPEEVVIHPGETIKVRTGLAIKMPPGWHALINMRSSTWSKYHVVLTNQTGIIDNAYCGNNDEWLLSIFLYDNFGSTVTIPKGARIAQFRLEHDSPYIEWEEVADLGTEDRGGFGSTGN